MSHVDIRENPYKSCIQSDSVLKTGYQASMNDIVEANIHV